MRIVIYLLIFTNILTGQIDQSVYPKAPYSNVNNLAVDGDNIFMSGTCDIVTISHDDGQTWKNIELPDAIYSVTAIPSSGGNAYFLTASKVYLYKASDETFLEVSKSSMQLEGGSFVNAHVHNGVTYVVSHGAIFKASPAYDWTNIMTLNYTDGVTQHSDLTPNSIFVVSNKGEVKKLDLATTTITNLKNLGNRANNFDMVTEMTGYATVSGETYVQRTKDGGATFSSVADFPENISATGYGDDIILTINTNRMYRSTNGGPNAKYLEYPTDGTVDLIQDYFITADGVFYLAGRSSTIIRTRDFGDTYENLNPFKKEWLADLQIHSSGTGYAIGGEQTIIKTTDDGANWDAIDASFLGEENYLGGVVVFDANTLGIAGSKGFFVLENDNLKYKSDGNFNSVLFNRAGNYLICVRYNGSAYEVAKSTDRGVTWTRKSFAPDVIQKIYQSITGKLYLAQYTGSLITSIDNGETWEIEEVPDLTSITEVAFWDDDFGLISSGSKVYKTTDSGKTVELIKSAYSARNFEFTSKDHFVFTGAQNSKTTLFESIDGGENVTSAKFYCSVTNNTFFDGDNTIWLAQQGGHINKYLVTGPSASTDINIEPLHAYPNPIKSSDVLTVKTNGQSGTLSFYNPMRQLVKQVQINGGEEASITLENFRVGLHMVQYKTENRLLIQKIIVIE